MNVSDRFHLPCKWGGGEGGLDWYNDTLDKPPATDEKEHNFEARENADRQVNLHSVHVLPHHWHTLSRNLAGTALMKLVTTRLTPETMEK